jgi:propionate catabolism operon transcriptional regulator
VFRADLYFRLNLLQIELPPLRERRGDIPQLARHLLARSATQYGFPALAVERVLEFLTPLFEHYAWPGNVRELENLIARAAIYLGDGASGAWQDLRDVFPEFGRMHAPSVAVGANGNAVNAASAVSAPPVAVTRDDVQRALDRHGGNRAAASRALGIGRTTLWRLMKK